MPYNSAQSVSNHSNSSYLFSTIDLAEIKTTELLHFPGRISSCCLVVFTTEGALLLYIMDWFSDPDREELMQFTLN